MCGQRMDGIPPTYACIHECMQVDQDGIPPLIAAAHPRISTAHFTRLQKDNGFLTRSMPTCTSCYLREPIK